MPEIYCLVNDCVDHLVYLMKAYATVTTA